jgi:hypothetical protein
MRGDAMRVQPLPVLRLKQEIEQIQGAALNLPRIAASRLRFTMLESGAR